MPKKRVLFISGSIGLGHITRDLAIANALRRRCKNIEIDWLAAHPASMVLEQAGENLLPQAEGFANDNLPAEQSADGYRLNLLTYLRRASRDWSHNVEVFRHASDQNHYDVVIGDETYELAVGFQKNPMLKKAPFVIIYDFVGLDPMTNNPLDRMGTYIWNRIWSKDYIRGIAPVFDLGLFVGVEEDVADKSFGWMLPNRREWARALLQFLGYVFPFSPGDFKDRSKLREKLHYGKAPLIVCAIGGTSIGKELLKLCAEAYPIIKGAFPGLQMVMVCGPRIKAGSFDVPIGIEIKEYVPALYEHFAACDLAIVQGGGTSTFELTALKRPFIFFSIEGHFEQVQVAARLSRYGAGINMSYSSTTPYDLAMKAISMIGKEVNHADIPTDGAERAAELIARHIFADESAWKKRNQPVHMNEWRPQ